jgi:hypothetical protein
MSNGGNKNTGTEGYLKGKQADSSSHFENSLLRWREPEVLFVKNADSILEKRVREQKTL